MIVLLALATGARRGEFANLTWDCVDLKTGTAYLGDTKNEDARTLPIWGPALEALRDYSISSKDRFNERQLAWQPAIFS
jgi:integrase